MQALFFFSVHEASMSFHLLVSSSVFLQYLEFCLQKSFVSQVRFIPRFVFLPLSPFSFFPSLPFSFLDIVNWIVSMISFSVCHLYVGKLLIFCVLILLPAILMKLFISCINFWCSFQGLLCKNHIICKYGYPNFFFYFYNLFSTKDIKLYNKIRNQVW